MGRSQGLPFNPKLIMQDLISTVNRLHSSKLLESVYKVKGEINVWWHVGNRCTNIQVTHTCLVIVWCCPNKIYNVIYLSNTKEKFIVNFNSDVGDTLLKKTERDIVLCHQTDSLYELDVKEYKWDNVTKLLTVVKRNLEAFTIR